MNYKYYSATWSDIMPLSSATAATSAATRRRASCDEDDTKASFSSLPDFLLQEIFSFLTFFECRKVAGLNKSLWRLQREQIEENMEHLTLTEKEGNHLFMMRFNGMPYMPFVLESAFGQMNQSLQSLNLNRSCTDQLLHDIFIGARLFPNLVHLKMRCCEGVTDLGLEHLSQVTHCHNLELLDIAYCSNTTYRGTLALRSSIRFPMLRMIRRQPEWLDGHIETPFGNATLPGAREVHTYYADGSFQFSNRDNESNGFVCEYIPGELQDGDLFVQIKVQFNDFPVHLYEGVPSWIPLAYHPGVCLLRLPPAPLASEEEGGQEDIKKNDSSSPQEQHDHATATTNTTRTTCTGTTNAVLVGQYTIDQRAPHNRALMERVAQDEELVPFGETRYFDKKTEALIPNPNHSIDMIMISRMRVRPFSTRGEHDESSAAAVTAATTATTTTSTRRRIDLLAGAPPLDLFSACVDTCRRIQAHGPLFLKEREEELNALALDSAERALADAAQDE